MKLSVVLLCISFIVGGAIAQGFGPQFVSVSTFEILLFIEKNELLMINDSFVLVKYVKSVNCIKN